MPQQDAPAQGPASPDAKTVDLVNREEAAKIRRISVSSLDRLGKMGELPKVKIGGRVLYARPDLLAYVQRAGGAA